MPNIINQRQERRGEGEEGEGNRVTARKQGTRKHQSPPGTTKRQEDRRGGGQRTWEVDRQAFAHQSAINQGTNALRIPPDSLFLTIKT